MALQYEQSGVDDGPVVLVCHALTGNHESTGTADAPGWWSGLVGDDRFIDTTRYQVITFNVLGGCNGSTGPASINPETGTPYRSTFPAITVRDMVHAQYKALQRLGITQIHTVIGGSLGGMQAQEWALLYPEMVESAIILASTPTLSDYGIAYNHIARTAITSDPAWQHGEYQTNEGLKGLEIARMIGMVSYRSAPLFAERFLRSRTENGFEINAYLDHQGKKLCSRFDANSYLCLLDAMDQHDIGQDRGGWQKAAATITVPMLLISFAHDLIYEPSQIREFAACIPNSIYHHVETTFGHDGFLTEYEKWGKTVKHFVQNILHEKVVQ